MKHVALRPFGWYPDGFTREALNVGDERDFGSIADGLVAAGMIGEIKPARAISTEGAPIVPPAMEIAQAATPDALEPDLPGAADKPRRGRKPKQD